MKRWMLTWMIGSVVLAAGEEKAPEIEVPACCQSGGRQAAIWLEVTGNPKPWGPMEDCWKWKAAGKELVLEAQSKRTFKVRRPKNLLWYQAREFRDFTLTAELRLTTFNEGNNDLCLAFGKVADDRFYYVHLGEKADEAHHQVHLVDRADRKPITTWRTGGMPWKEGKWHRVKVVRNAETGDIGVWVDDGKEPVLTAKDRTLEWGQIGLGSFDDTGEFRNVRIRGISREAR